MMLPESILNNRIYKAMNCLSQIEAHHGTPDWHPSACTNVGHVVTAYQQVRTRLLSRSQTRLLPRTFSLSPELA